jgi:hypothetical protein
MSQGIKLTRELLSSKDNKINLSVEQTLLIQDAAFALEGMDVVMAEIREDRRKAQEFSMPVPRITTDLITITDNFTQAVCNTYRVEIKPLLKTVAAKELLKN